MSTLAHGHAKKKKFSPEYHSWSSMIQRCTNKNRKTYADYGGRGIKVCDRWLKFTNFLADMGPRPEGTSLERMDVNKGYEPGNCCWADRTTQSRNSRQAVWVEINGVSKRLTEWCDEKQISINTVRSRVKKQGWSYSDAITKPKQDLSLRDTNGRLARRAA